MVRGDEGIAQPGIGLGVAALSPALFADDTATRRTASAEDLARLHGAAAREARLTLLGGAWGLASAARRESQQEGESTLQDVFLFFCTPLEMSSTRPEWFPLTPLQPDVMSEAADWMDRQRAIWTRLFDVVDAFLDEEESK